MKPAQDSKSSKGKESTPSTKDAADGDKVRCPPPKNDKKSPSELLRKGDDIAPSAPLNKDKKPSPLEQLRKGDDIAPSAPLNKDKKPSPLEPLRSEDDTSTHTHTESNKDTKGSGKQKELATWFSEQGKINKGDDSNAWDMHAFA